MATGYYKISKSVYDEIFEIISKNIYDGEGIPRLTSDPNVLEWQIDDMTRAFARVGELLKNCVYETEGGGG